MLQVTINNKVFALDNENAGLKIDGELIGADIAPIGTNAYHVISNKRSYNVEIVNFDTALKTAVIKVNGNTYPVAVKDQFDLLLEQMGMGALKTGVVDDLKAPMPGMVLKVLVTPGNEVKKGDNLFVLEAMKMENIIKAPGDAFVKAVKIIPGDKVEKGQVLITFAQ